uniref:Uncharacterized protein n=1 Tax=Oryza punctata TaxID=4537 RepID=A0A0E0LPA2_ORYPU
MARRREGVAVADVPALRPLLRTQLVERQGGRVRALGSPPRRPPRLLLLLPRHGLRHPRPGSAPPRRPRLPPLPPEQPSDPRPRRHRRCRHLPLHVHLRAQDDTDTIPYEPGAAANRAELRRRIRRFRQEGRVVVGEADRRRQAENVRAVVITMAQDESN